MKKCSPEERVELVESVLKAKRTPMKPKEILDEINTKLKKNGYETLDTIYMSRIITQSNMIGHEKGGYYFYNFSRSNQLAKTKELKSMLQHFTGLTVMNECTPIILTVVPGYEKIICNLMCNLYRSKGIYCFEGVGCILMVIKDRSVLTRATLKRINDALDDFYRQHQPDTKSDT